MNHRNANLAALATFVALAALLAARPAHALYDDFYTAGHADLNISYSSSSQSLHLDYAFGSNAVVNGSVLGSAQNREASTITVFIGVNGLVVGPAALPAPFGGVSLWTLPQTSRSGRPFLGIGAESISPGVFQSDALSLNVTGFAQRPAGGEFVVWQTGSESTPTVNTANGFSSADSIPIDAGGHDHYVYGFTTAGIYDVIITGRGKLANGTDLTTVATYRFQAGGAVPEPGALASMGIGLGILFVILARRRLSVSAKDSLA